MPNGSRRREASQRSPREQGASTPPPPEISRDPSLAPSTDPDNVTFSVDGELLILDKAQATCRRLFIIGCFFLPWAWIMNVAYYWPDFYRKDGDPYIKRFTRYSLFGAVAYAVLFGAWTVFFMSHGIKIGSVMYNKLDIMNVNLATLGL